MNGSQALPLLAAELSECARSAGRKVIHDRFGAAGRGSNSVVQPYSATTLLYAGFARADARRLRDGFPDPFFPIAFSLLTSRALTPPPRAPTCRCALQRSGAPSPGP
jgi:hypothetical protein